MINNKEKSSGNEALNWVLVLAVSILFGSLGIDRFLMGHVWLGLIKMLTLGGLGVWWITDVVLIISKHHFKNIVWLGRN